MPKTKLHFTGSDPSPERRKALTKSYRKALKAAEGDSNDAEIEALQDLRDDLMAYAGIEVV